MEQSFDELIAKSQNYVHGNDVKFEVNQIFKKILSSAIHFSLTITLMEVSHCLRMLLGPGLKFSSAFICVALIRIPYK